MAHDQEIVVTIRHEEVDIRAGTRKAVTVPLRYDSTRRETIQVFREWLDRNDRVTLQLVNALGRQLFDMIFHEAALAELARTFREASGKRVRIQLSFDPGAHHLAALPWEFMYWDRGGSAAPMYLATQMSLSLCRYMELDDERSPLEIPEGELRVLLVASKPDPELSKLHAVDETAVWEALGTARSELAKRDPSIHLALSKLDVATIDALERRVRAERPHVIHFLGHGRFAKGRGAIALLEPDEVRLCWCPDDVFAQCVAPEGAVPPLLVVLHMCEGAVVDFEQSFRGIAPQLVLHGIPAVVAMQYSIPDGDAQLFSTEFYRRLGEGLPVDSAVQNARWRMYQRAKQAEERQSDAKAPERPNVRGFGTPVLYLHSLDGVIRPATRLPANDPKARDIRVPELATNVPADPRANGATAAKIEPGPATQNFPAMPPPAERPPESQVSIRVTGAIIDKLWKAVQAECQAQSYDVREVTIEVQPIMRADSVETIRIAIREKIRIGFVERFYSVYVRMDGVLDAEKVPG